MIVADVCLEEDAPFSSDLVVCVPTNLHNESQQSPILVNSCLAIVLDQRKKESVSEHAPWEGALAVS